MAEKNKDSGIFDDDFFSEDKPVSCSAENAPMPQCNAENIPDKATSSVENVVETKADSIVDTQKPELCEDSNLPQLCGEGYPPAFVDMVNRVHSQYQQLPQLNYDALYAELASLTVKCHTGGSFQVLNAEIQRVQSAKDRLSEICLDVSRNYFIKKRVVDVIRDAWGKFTDEKNAEKRKGDCSYRLSNFEIDFARVEALFRVMMHILRNLDSLHESLSRRISIYQSLLKMNDVGRDALPDYDFEKGVKDPHAYEDEAEGGAANSELDTEQSEGRKAKLESF